MNVFIRESVLFRLWLKDAVNVAQVCLQVVCVAPYSAWVVEAVELIVYQPNDLHVVRTMGY